MNTNIDNNLSFKARLKTKINRLKPIGKKMTEISKGINGTLSIYSDKGMLMASDGKSEVYVGDVLAQYFSIPRPAEETITSYADKALNTLQLLRAETSYASTTEKLKKNNAHPNHSSCTQSYNAFQKKLDALSSKSLAPFIYEELKGAI